MDVTVTGAGGSVGRRLLPSLMALPSVERVLALDSAELSVPAGVAAGVVDVRDPAIGDRLVGADVLVHLVIGDDPHLSDAAMHDRNVAGTRMAVDAAVEAGARRIVVVTAASVYGATADNDVPLTESSPRRAPIDAPGARHVAEVEDWLWERATTLPPDTTLTVLRPATIVGGDAVGPVHALVGMPRLPIVSGHRPPVQVVHIDDLVAAIVLAASEDLPGAYNVAAPGWVSVAETAAVLGRRTISVPEEVARGIADAVWRSGATAGRGSRVDYLMHPWVVDVRRLEAAGWSPDHSNRDALALLADAEAPYLRVGTSRMRRDRVALVLVGAAAAWTALVALLARRLRR